MCQCLLPCHVPERSKHPTCPLSRETLCHLDSRPEQLTRLLLLLHQHPLLDSNLVGCPVVPPHLQVLLQCLCAQADPTRTTQGSQQASQQGSQQQVLTTADVNTRAQELLTEADLEYLQDDEMLLNRCARSQLGRHTGVYVTTLL